MTRNGPRSTPGLVLLVTLCLIATPVTGQLASNDAFPGHDTVQDKLDTYAEDPWVEVFTVGQSVENRTIRIAEVTNPNGSIPVEDRVVTLILTQQHGNEPAGTPAALRLMDNITARNQQADWLDKQVLLVLPMINPDGSEANTRGNANGVDVNRDHIALDTPEAKALHEVLNRWNVHVAMDHHEYGGTGPGNPVPVRLYDYDVLTLFPKHGNVRAPTLELAKDLMYDGIWPELNQSGYSVHEYGELTAAGEPVQQLAGGPDPGILRNHFGLHNIAGLLIESRIDQHPNPFHPPERRIQANTVVMEAALETVHQSPEHYIAAKEASQQVAQTLPADEYVEGSNRAPMADAYKIPNTTAVRETFAHHGIDPGTSQGDTFLHRMGHPLEGHAAALFHNESSRNIVNGSPVDVGQAGPNQTGETSQDGDETNQTPISQLTGLAAVLTAAALATRRRTAA